MKTITSLLLGALSSALTAIGFSSTAARLDPLAHVAAANHGHLHGTAAFCGIPTNFA